jgi:predicted O-methyltransferase YrrM
MKFLSRKVVNKVLNNTIPSFQLTSREDTNLGFGGIYYSLTRAIRPKSVVAIGSKAGFTPIMFALALKHNGGYGIGEIECEETSLVAKGVLPMLHFIDPSYSLGRDQNHWYGLGKWDDHKEVWKLWKNFGVEKIATHYKMTSAEYLKDPTSFNSIDILFVDGDHSYAGITHDFTAFYERLAPDALVLTHDVDPKLKSEVSELMYPDSNLDNTKTGGYDAFRDISEDMYEKFRFPVYPGLALMRKRRERKD